MLAADGGGGDWKGGLSMPKKDERFKTTDVTDTRGQEFEDYFLKRELLMGIFEKALNARRPYRSDRFPSSTKSQCARTSEKWHRENGGIYYPVPREN